TDPGTDLTLLLPRRTYSPVLGRLLHDRTADEIARATSRLPRVVATIIPFDVESALDDHDSGNTGPAGSTEAVAAPSAASNGRASGDFSRDFEAVPPPPSPPDPAAGSTPGPMATGGPPPLTPIGDLGWRQRATIEGDIRAVRAAALSGAPTLEVELWDPSGGITLVFYGRRHIPGLEPGRRVRASGMVGDVHGCLAISNPLYELVSPSRL
ncbi:MAG: OB-fold nucleic acid binding domain-containing protein, partial [Actinomycetes bacterium]